ncbi:hypothetical protein VST52_07155 [Pseudomonas aeruginosa]|uniref:hypothetical protein n=1 Tax=Pseudomonas aeruginosa TaxID=287 RepID=UPI003982827D
MSKFKAGDIAMIIGANVLTQNIGKVVELSAFVEDGDLYVGPGAELCRHSDIGCWVVRGEGLFFRTDKEVREGFSICEERHLMPLPKEQTPEQQKAKGVEA